MATLSNTTSSAGNFQSTSSEKGKSAINTGLISLSPETVQQLSHLKDEAMDKAAVYYEQSEKYVRKNPFYFIGGAVVLGYLAGTLLTRKY